MYFIARSFRVGAGSGALTTSRSQRPVLDILPQTLGRHLADRNIDP
jgi:hypothetical protein